MCFNDTTGLKKTIPKDTTTLQTLLQKTISNEQQHSLNIDTVRLKIYTSWNIITYLTRAACLYENRT